MGGDFRSKIDWAGNYDDGLSAMKKNIHDIFIVDYGLNDGKSGLDIIRKVRIIGVTTPVILFTYSDTQKIPQDDSDKLNISRCLLKYEYDPTLLISVIVDTVLHYNCRDWQI